MGGRGWPGWSGVKGGKWDNCNSIINKYIKKEKKTQPQASLEDTDCGIFNHWNIMLQSKQIEYGSTK